MVLMDTKQLQAEQNRVVLTQVMTLAPFFNHRLELDVETGFGLRLVGRCDPWLGLVHRATEHRQRSRFARTVGDAR